jgi:hypothetical protein
MNELTEKFFEISPHGYFTSHEAAVLFPGSADRRYGLVKRAIAGGEIIQIRRGLYCLAPKYRKKNINQFALAEHIHGPSYISLESALSWHSWIPEAVYTVTSVALGKSKEFHTPLGVFSYTPVPQKILYAGVERMADGAGDVFFMASPIKALADYAYVHRKNWTGLGPCAEDLRIDPEEMMTTRVDEIDLLLENYTVRRVRRFLEGVGRELGR